MSQSGGASGAGAPQCVYEVRSQVIVAVESAVVTVVIVTTIMRAIVRLRIIKAPSWDDLLLLLGFLLVTTDYCVEMRSTHLGLGQHVYCVDPENIMKMTPLQYVCQVLTTASTMFTRASICIFLLRLFSISRAGRIFLYSLLALIVVMGVVTAALITPRCTPSAKLWNPTIAGHCSSRQQESAIGYINGSVSVFCDLALSFFPFYFLKNLQMQWKVKVAVCVLMGLGVVTAAFALLRTLLFSQIKGMDITYELFYVVLFTWLEAAVAVIVANIPTIKPLFVPNNNRSPAAHAAPVIRSASPANSSSGLFKKMKRSFGSPTESRRLPSDAEAAEHLPRQTPGYDAKAAQDRSDECRYY